MKEVLCLREKTKWNKQKLVISIKKYFPSRIFEWGLDLFKVFYISLCVDSCNVKFVLLTIGNIVNVWTIFIECLSNIAVLKSWKLGAVYRPRPLVNRIYHSWIGFTVFVGPYAA